MDAIHTLMKHGADKNAENAFGLNMIHVAAQGDQAASLYYFKKINVDINKQDKRGSTPLHWACYSDAEIALTYLLAWNPDMNKQDQDGVTPLHLAVNHVDQVGSARPVRFLLVRGAEKTIADKQGKIPADLVKDVKNSEVARELNKMLGRPGAFDCLMLSTQTRYIKRSSKNMMMFCFLFFYTILIELFYIFPSKYPELL